MYSQHTTAKRASRSRRWMMRFAPGAGGYQASSGRLGFAVVQSRLCREDSATLIPIATSSAAIRAPNQVHNPSAQGHGWPAWAGWKAGAALHPALWPSELVTPLLGLSPIHLIHAASLRHLLFQQLQQVLRALLGRSSRGRIQALLRVNRMRSTVRWRRKRRQSCVRMEPTCHSLVIWTRVCAPHNVSLLYC